MSFQEWTENSIRLRQSAQNPHVYPCTGCLPHILAADKDSYKYSKSIQLEAGQGVSQHWSYYVSAGVQVPFPTYFVEQLNGNSEPQSIRIVLRL